MSASAIAAARHERQDRRNFANAVPSRPPPSHTQGARLHEALLGSEHNVTGNFLVLPPTSVFEEATPPLIEMPLTGRGAHDFVHHTVFHLSRDVKRGTGLDEQKVDAIHCFVLRDSKLNSGIAEWALNRERKCAAAKHAMLARTIVPEQLDDLGKLNNSNRGGYQSQPNIFDIWPTSEQSASSGRDGHEQGMVHGISAPPEVHAAPGRDGRLGLYAPAERAGDGAELAGRPYLRELHRIASEALDQMSRDQMSRDQARDGVLRGEGAPSTYGTYRDGAAWVNVNRGGDANSACMHSRFASRFALPICLSIVSLSLSAFSALESNMESNHSLPRAWDGRLLLSRRHCRARLARGRVHASA